MKFDLSIIIVNYNTGNLLGKCVEAVIKTTDGFENPECEVVLVDNASTDGSVNKIKSSPASPSEAKYHTAPGEAGRAKLKVQNDNLKFKIIKNKKNFGFARAVNKGIKASSGEYVLLLNPDTEVKKGAIKKMLEFAKKTPDAGVVGARLLNPDGSVQPSVFHFPTIGRAIQEYWFGQKGAYSKYTPLGKNPVSVDAVVGAAFMITPTALKKAGVLDERFFLYFEDLDYCRRVRSHGLKVYYLPEAEVTHIHGASAKTVLQETSKWIIESSKAYHGLLKYWLLYFILWSGQKFLKN